MAKIQDKILISRELKYQEMQFLKMSFKSVISVKANIPGENKQVNISYLLTNHFKKLIPLDMVLYSEYYDGYDGPYFLIGNNLEPKEVKMRLIAIEDHHELGRFIDLDVFDGNKMISRGKMRKCFVCERDAFFCIRENRHSLEEIQKIINDKVYNYFSRVTIEIVNDSIMHELNLHPKFGLVTPYSSGSHPDMNYELMVKAKDSILPFFKKMFSVGWSTEDPQTLFASIRKIGLNAEKEMNKVTDGVNAYKGLIFNLGILVTAYSYVLYNNVSIENVFQFIKKMTSELLMDYEKPDTSFGSKAYHLYGLTGARGEAYDGFPTVQKALDYLLDLSNESKLRTLVYLISASQDTVLLKRAGSIEDYRSVKQLFKNSLKNNLVDLEELNQLCIQKKLSFGGSADLLIMTLFLKKIGLKSNIHLQDHKQ